DTPVNIGNPSEMSVREMAEAIIRLTGSKSRIIEKPLPEDDPKVRQPDITKAKALLGWEPKVGIEEGLANTLGYFRKKLNIA
ncbi:MAG TPA: SDR family NAD-dependent epimerase/dehydratase, partial [Nitrospirota bacterium]